MSAPSDRGGRVPLDRAQGPFVLALDIGSTGSRGDVYDAAGQPVEGNRHKVPHAFAAGGDGTSVLDADAVVGEVEEILDALAVSRLAGRVGGVAIDTFASSLVGVTADGRACTPCFTYADSRCGAQVVALREELDEAAVHQRTGTRLHSSYLAPRLRWLRETDPETFRQARRWISLGEYVYLRLAGVTAAGTATAAWTGLLDRRTGAWDPELVAAAGVDVEQLSEVRDPSAPLRDVAASVASRWPALVGAAWFPAVADGLSSNVGVGAVDGSAMAASAATSGAMRVLVHHVPDELPSGLWCYRVDASRSLLGGAVNDVGRAVTWLESTIRLAAGASLDTVAAAEPGPGAPLVLPYFSGERATGWAANARATLTGVSAATTGSEVARGVLEGVAISYARIADQLRSVSGPASTILASGRVAQDVPSFLQILADVLAAPVVPVTTKRATLRGTALLALEVLAPDVERVGPAVGETLTPVEGRAEYYRGRREAYQGLYAAVVG
ncbi:gluconokinase [Friedmanniella luteola]|uniref:Gluconokinase n=1 Tax=Friedmanniella luteola TaxID=546871 RepID=A0A1H1ZJY9_9ACTN|nr:gluconokinase [Friedmanniella luteola]SDT33546.1 gluconokinase [Friedmanniella luteola]